MNNNTEISGSPVLEVRRTPRKWRPANLHNGFARSNLNQNDTEQQIRQYQADTLSRKKMTESTSSKGYPTSFCTGLGVGIGFGLGLAIPLLMFLWALYTHKHSSVRA